MNQNRDWKPIAALILAGLALLIAFSGSSGFGFNRDSAAPQQFIIAPSAPSTGPAGSGGGITVPALPQPGPAAGSVTRSWGSHYRGWIFFPFCALFPLLLIAGLIFLVLRGFGPRRRGWGGPGGPWGGPWGGPGPGPQAPPPPPYGQPYQQYPQGQPPQYGQQPPQGQGYPQGQPPQDTDAHGDITRPEGSGNY